MRAVTSCKIENNGSLYTPPLNHKERDSALKLYWI